ncbi:MAG: HEAT repeat domain-containing protein [Terriglobia bacterium]|jgi:hypothetical protein
MVPALLVLVTFLFWYQTWFGRRLTDREISQYLSDTSVPHKTQHALTQLAERMARGDAAARQWYPQVIRLAASKESGFRVMAAWVMGQDRNAPEFHSALLRLLGDAEPMVRRNAALALVRFGDAAGRPELRAMLRPYSVVAPAAGTVTFRIKESESLRNGVTLARLQPVAGDSIDVISPVGGTLQRRAVPDSANVSAQEAIAVIAPGEDQVWEALRALYLVGKTEDLPDVESPTWNNAKMSDRVHQQAVATAQAIRARRCPEVYPNSLIR